MKKVCWFLMGLLCLSMRVNAQNKKVVIFADDNYPPYSFVGKDKKLEGIYKEILEVAFSRMTGYDILMEPGPWKRGLKQVETGNGFGIFPPYFRPKQRPYLNPYSKPILPELVVVFCNEKTLKQKKRPNWPQDYFGLSFANNSGFKLGGDEFYKAVSDGKIKMEETKGNRANILKVLRGHLNCYINDKYSILWEFKKMKEEGVYKPDTHQNIDISVVVKEEHGHIGYARNDKKFPFKADFVKQLDAIIQKMKDSKEIDKIVNRYLNL